MIEQQLERIAVALESIAQGFNAPKGLPSQAVGNEKPEPQAPVEQPVQTQQQAPVEQPVQTQQEAFQPPSKEAMDKMRTHLNPIVQSPKHGGKFVVGLLQQLGVTKLSELPESRFDELAKLAETTLAVLNSKQ